MNIAQKIILAVDRIHDGNGFVISTVGMLIVFTALALISLFIAAMPKVLKLVSYIFPDKSTRDVVEDERVAIAIGTALHYHNFIVGKEKE